ncbi:hypothetical protein Nocox_30485 [Nonomuraea coxensis DSM 45129]|uniref:Uncharacterized protein n=1 Tax=Nonomuraea coxensis DSM 45129 TaxID=1122611 RepID=A0ABX8U9R3_9ACTN|nr:hypothetical protein [Nonomuraea coxensis]QYC43681.1 hypothetical protein Nocox_30485 [Nonomuraea coxensis DSM 45129]
MLRRHRLGVPAFIVTGVYLSALVVAVVVALAAGDLGALWWMTLFAAPDASIQATWLNVLLLTLAGLVVAWALWEFLRGPLTGASAEQDRDTWRLRVALYVAAASTLVNPFLVSWSLWGTVVSFVPMVGVVLLLSPVVGRTRRHVLILLVCGILGYGGAAVGLGLALSGHAVGALGLVAGFGSLIWNVLVLRAQWDNDRFQRATVKYGILALVLPLVLMMAGGLSGVPREVYDDVVAVAGVLAVVWLARSAHDLDAPSAVSVASA